MPPNYVHCAHSLKRYGKSFKRLHKWMDEPVKGLGSAHRIYRHNLKKTPQEVKELFGKMAGQACIDHILLDKKQGDLTSLRKPTNVIPTRQYRRIKTKI